MQRPLPQHLLTRLAGWLASRRTRWVKNMLISLFDKAFDINWSEAVGKTKHDYDTFNEWFSRALEPGARPLADADELVSPCDGALSEYGLIKAGRLLQAKDIDYSLEQLLGCSAEQAETFRQGRFFTIYLAPRDYHRVHMPMTGRLIRCTHIPGRLFSVSPVTAQYLPGLFCRNERVVCWFEDHQGQYFAVVLVGAMMVGSIATCWHGRFQHRSRETAQDMPIPVEPLTLQRGDELGRFLMGSTVIVITSRHQPSITGHHGKLKARQSL